MNICGIKIYSDIDPFFLESKIIAFQSLWLYNKYHRHKYYIIKNINNIGNNQDPISLNKIIKNNKIININNLYPIFKNGKMYVYELKSLNDILKNDVNEIYTNLPFLNHEVNSINFLLSKINTQGCNASSSLEKIIKYTDKEKIYFLKINIFQKFYELGTYFTLELYESINKTNLQQILSELKMIWNSFKEDNNINENEMFQKQLNWKYTNDVEDKLLNNINIMINNNLEDNFKKSICYLIIGAFCYVDKELKKIYNNIVFI